MILFNIFLVLLGFTGLVVVHELGHYLAAKWAGIRVDGFAVGMGPVVGSWRRGIGLVAGSTERHVRNRVGRSAIELSDDELRQEGIGETEWSLRALPLGGFVKMLGQDDLHPTRPDGATRSYMTAPIGRRMVVVSAGVIANAILAVILFMVAFLVGVRFEAPVVGDVLPGSPAATAVPRNGPAVGVDVPGLLPGDRVLSIDGEPARTFSDIDISAAMGHPDAPLSITVERPGVADPLRFAMNPVRDERIGLLTIGVGPARSTTLSTQREIAALVDAQLDDSGLSASGVRPGMTLVEANGTPVETWRDLDAIITGSGGAELPTVWRSESGPEVTAMLAPRPELETITVPAALSGERDEFVSGLLGLVPLVKVRALSEGSANRGVLEPGDAILRIAPVATGEGSVDAPRTAQFLRAVQAAKGESLELTILRRDEIKNVLVKVNRQGQIGIILGQALDLPYTAGPVDRIRRGEEILPSAVAAAGILGGTRISSVDGGPVANWIDLRERLLAATSHSTAAERGAEIELTVVPPVDGAAPETLALRLSPEDVRSLHQLGWRPPFDEGAFNPLTTLLSADGNPFRAVAMGFRETRKLVSMTYLTLYRLFQRTVGVDQLRGPVGIVHLGTAVVDHGWPYMLFFLAMISVNLAVLNFLPLPIVDGGLFLYLVYEKLRGEPPSIAFQNIATMAGLCLIVGIFVMTFYFDMMRLVG